MARKYKRQWLLRENQFAYSVKKAGLKLGVGKTFIYHLISTGALWTVTIRDRQLVPRSALEGFIKSSADIRA
jgi:hypothetical protein